VATDSGAKICLYSRIAISLFTGRRHVSVSNGKSLLLAAAATHAVNMTFKAQKYTGKKLENVIFLQE
jgi:hypothetical protein